MRESNTPRFSRILDWLEGRLSEEEARAVAEQLSMADEATQADLAWLMAFHQITQTVKLVSPPPQVRDVLNRRFEAHTQTRPPLGFFRRLLANLTFDSRVQPVVAGIRSAATEGLQRQLIYTTEVAEIALNLQPRAGGQSLTMTGQVFPATDEAPGPFSLQLLRDAAEVGLATTDKLGEFAFDDVPVGEYELVVSADQFEVVITSIPVRA